jgi:hypothetical protein
MNMPCPQPCITCPGDHTLVYDSPTVGIRLEQRDGIEFIGIADPSGDAAIDPGGLGDPPLGDINTARGVVSVGTSTVSQDDADTNAKANADQSVINHTYPPGTSPVRPPGLEPGPTGTSKHPAPPPDHSEPIPWYVNDPQSCSFPCPDGGFFTATVGPVSVTPSKDLSNAIARSIACMRASLAFVCLPSLPTRCCRDTWIDWSLVPLGGVPPISLQWTNGTMPPGLGLTAQNHLAGAATTLGSYTFDITATDATGATETRTYTVEVVGIDPRTINVDTGTPFSVSLTFGTPPGFFSVAVGSLPSGVVLDTDGLLHGTCAADGLYQFTVQGEDSGGSSCFEQISIDSTTPTPPPPVGPDWSTLVWTTSLIPPGIGSVSASGDTISGAVAGDDGGGYTNYACVDGNLTYTGPGANCIIRITAIAVSGGVASQIGFVISQDGVPVYISVGILPQVPHDIPFSLSAGVASAIQITGYADGVLSAFLAAGAGIPGVLTGGHISATVKFMNVP